MPDLVYERLTRGEQIVGLFVVNDCMPIRQAIDELLLLVAYSKQAEGSCTVPAFVRLFTASEVWKQHI